MLRRFTSSLLLFTIVSLQASGQALVFDRGVQNSALHSAGWTKNDKAFVADDFRIGKAGEVWMIDRVRTWAVVKQSGGALPDLFSSLTLFGGLVDPANSNKPRPPEDCECHGLVHLIKSIDLVPGRDSSSPDLKISESPAGGPVINGRVFQVDFENVRWSIPGGTDAQFGIRANARSNTPTAARPFYDYVVPGPADHLRVFDNDGHFVSMYSPTAKTLRIPVQVWAHLSVDVNVRSRQSALELTIKSSPSLDARRTDRSSLNVSVGGINVVPRIERGGNGQETDLILVASAPAMRTATPPSVCVTGKRSDGMPFEGCGLLAH